MKNQTVVKSLFFKFLHNLIRSRIFYLLLSVSIIITVVENSSGNEIKKFSNKEAFLALDEPSLNEIHSESIKAVEATKADSIISYAHSLHGIPYKWAGKSTEGFDCSGFIFHVFNKYGIELPASSAVIFTVGTPVTKDELVKGDLVFFTGTDISIRKVSHVGIISSEPDEKLQFIHSSSGGGGRGVTVNDLDHPHYQARYFGAKRVVENM
jgi:cell wall-associated NlpC family hydrolase